LGTDYTDVRIADELAWKMNPRSEVRELDSKRLGRGRTDIREKRKTWGKGEKKGREKEDKSSRILDRGSGKRKNPQPELSAETSLRGKKNS